MGPDPLAGHTVELCSGKGGYEVTPEDARELDLSTESQRLADAGVEIVTDAGVLLVVDPGPCEVSVFESGRLLAKTDDQGEAEEAARAILAALAES
ncbi:hypothetical protein BRD56_05005 [Thermoplasmatales archaeon SW_10_69_26]|nr:MAG: hypothetical protein BRD56_05005 [Thermoplasmatales archaeon SW_10_69_26]